MTIFRPCLAFIRHAIPSCVLSNIAYSEKTEHTERTAAFKEMHENLLKNPRQALTAQTTVKPLCDMMMRNFSSWCMDYSKSLNGFAELRESASTFEIPYTAEWAKSNARKRRASIAW